MFGHRQTGRSDGRGGDLKLAGNSTLDNPNFTGDIYAGSQCEISGAPAVEGQIVCGGEPNPAGVAETVLENRIDGDLAIRYDCPAGGFIAGSLRPLQKRGWRQIY